GLARWFLPLSRAWAAATVAGGDLDRFLDEVPLDRLPSGSKRLTESALRRIDRLQRDYGDADAAWQESFYGPADPGLEALAEIDARRARASQRLMMGRSALVNLPMLGAVPRIRYAIPARELVEARFGGLAD